MLGRPLHNTIVNIHDRPQRPCNTLAGCGRLRLVVGEDGRDTAVVAHWSLTQSLVVVETGRQLVATGRVLMVVVTEEC
jgi:hypothetical protein